MEASKIRNPYEKCNVPDRLKDVYGDGLGM